MIPIERVLFGGLIVVLLLAPLPFGSVQPATGGALVTACLLLGALWVLWRARSGLRPLPWKDPLLAGGALLILFGAAQLVPLPGPTLERLSPAAADLRARYEPAATAPTGARPARPISLDPWATRRAVLRLAACLLVALIAADLAARGAGRTVLAAALVAGGGFQAVYGLIEFFSGRQHIFGYAKKYYTDAATGTFINRNHYAGYLEMTLPLAVALLAAAVARLRSARGGSTGERLANVPGRDLFRAGLLLLLAVVMATAIGCSRSRMGIAGACLSLVALGLVVGLRGRGRSLAAASLVVVGGTAVLFAQGSAGVPIVDRFLVAPSEFLGSIGRWSMWSDAWAMAQAFPLVGAGLGAFGSVFPSFRTSGEGVALDHAHDDYLEFAAEVGLIGCLLAIVALAVVVWVLFVRRRGRPDFGFLGYASCAAVAAIALHSLTDFNLAIPANAVTLSAVVGLLAAWRRAPGPALAAAAPARGVRPVSLAGASVPAVCAAALLAVAAILPWWPGGDPERLIQAAAAVEASALDDLQALAEARSGGQEPSATAARYVETRLETALAIQHAAMRAVPTSSAGHFGAAGILLGRCAAASLSEGPPPDCAGDAVREIRAAVALGPMNGTVHAQAARILIHAWPLLSADERRAGETIVRRALAMNPDDRALRTDLVAIAAAPAE